MQTHFGQTLFGAALGVVTAAGLAGAVAVASGKMNVRKAIPLTHASANAQVQGKVYRITRGLVQSAAVFATTSNHPVVSKKGSGLASAIAAASGKTKATYLGSGALSVYAEMTGFPIRISKPRVMTARAFAELFGQGFVYELVEPAPAIATASGFGTTYHLAYGSAVGEAQLQGQVVWAAGAAGHAIGTAYGQDTVRYTATMYGAEAEAFADIRWETVVKKNGRRYLDAYGAEASVVCEVELTNWMYYPSVTAYAYAYCQAQGYATVGGRGVAEATAQLEGTMIAAETSAGTVQSDSIAVAQGSLRAFPKGYGTAYASASGSADLEVTKTGLGICEGVAMSSATQALDAVVHNTKAHPDDGYGVAMCKAIMNRVRFMSGRAGETYATGVGNSVKIQFGYGVAQGKALPTARQYRIRIVGLIPAIANAVLSAQMRVNFMPPPANALAEAFGQMKRTHFASGEAFAAAIAEGANQVNDAVKAPATRTVLVTQESRTTVVLAESRTVIV